MIDSITSFPNPCRHFSRDGRCQYHRCRFAHVQNGRDVNPYTVSPGSNPPRRSSNSSNGPSRKQNSRHSPVRVSHRSRSRSSSPKRHKRRYRDRSRRDRSRSRRDRSSSPSRSKSPHRNSKRSKTSEKDPPPVSNKHINMIDEMFRAQQQLVQALCASRNITPSEATDALPSTVGQQDGNHK